MTDESPRLAARRENRRRAILAATMRLVRRHGTQISTAQIAAEAKCSKETLYKWFDDRDGIFRSLVEEQAVSMREVLDTGAARAMEETPDSTHTRKGFEALLSAYSLLLLDVATGDAALIANRIAMSSVSRDHPEIGQIIRTCWQESVEQRFHDLFVQGTTDGHVIIYDAEEAFHDLFGLLIGDRQRRLLLGGEGRPAPSALEAHARKAVRRWLSLYRN